MPSPCIDASTLADFVLGLVPRERALAVRAHVDSCARCSARLAGNPEDGSAPVSVQSLAGAAALAEEVPLVGQRVGRYVLRALIGAGAMGVVYRAWDPELVRPVAMKLLRTRDRRLAVRLERQQRFVREAQAMASISHPNVIAVHDVGVADGHVFFTMELIEGSTLDDWLLERERRPEDILSVFVQAGRGLAAAHAAGLVHRDFKPENVLIGADGRVCVTDFGLVARAHDEAPVGEPSPADALSRSLTQTGAVFGTPTYMAPEQHLGHAADARSDQFGFCVALYEALAGCHPFPAEEPEQLREAVLGAEVRLPRSVRVTRAARRAIERGLAKQPDARHPDMPGLLDQLGARAAGSRWRAVALPASILGALSLVAALVMAVLGPAAAVAPSCEDDRAVDRVWNEERRQAIGARFAAVVPAYGARLWPRVRASLDAYARQLDEMRAAACRSQNDVLARAQQRCLDARLAELHALAGLLAEGDRTAIDRSTSAVLALSSVEACADPGTLSAVAAAPDDLVLRKALRAELAHASTLQYLGREQASLLLVDELEPRIAEAGDPALEAELHLLRGALLANLGRGVEAEAALHRTIAAAEAAFHHRIRAEALVILVYVVGAVQNRSREGVALLGVAEAAVARVPRMQGILQARLDRIATSVLDRAGRGDEAVAYGRRALAAAVEVYGEDDLRVAGALTTLGSALISAQGYDEGAGHLERALRIVEAANGEVHPEIASMLANLGVIHALRGDFQLALASHQRALEVGESAWGPDSPRLVPHVLQYGTALGWAGEHEQALVMFDRALSIVEATPPDAGLSLALTHFNIGFARMELGELAAAATAMEAGLAVAREVLGPDHPIFAGLATGRAELWRRVGQPRKAIESFEAAWAVCAQTPCDADIVLENRVGLALALREDGRRDAVRPVVEEARQAAARASPAAVARFRSDLAALEAGQ